MRDENVGWALFRKGDSSAVLSRTADGAATWTRTAVTVPRDSDYNVAFPGPWSTVLATGVGGGALADMTVLVDRTSDAGRTWQKTSFDAGGNSGDDSYIDSLSFSSAREGRLTLSLSEAMNQPRGVAVDQLEMFLTHDGGATWHEAPVPAAHWREVRVGVTTWSVFVAGPTTPAWWTYQDCSTCPRILMHKGRPYPMPAAPLHCKKYVPIIDLSGKTNMIIEQDGVTNHGGWFVARCYDGDWNTFYGTTPTALFVWKRGRWRFAAMGTESESFFSVRPGVFWRASGSAITESRDDGKHWGPAHVPAELRAANLIPWSNQEVIVTFVSDRVGFALLPEKWLYRTADGGLSWSRL